MAQQLAQPPLCRQPRTTISIGRHGDHDPAHEGHEHHRGKSRPDAAPRIGIAVNLGQYVAEHVGQGKNSMPAPKVKPATVDSLAAPIRLESSRIATKAAIT